MSQNASCQHPALIAYPKQAAFGRVLPKSKIYEHSGANARLKEFIDSRGLTFMFALGFQAGALILHYISTVFDVVLLSDADSNLIAISTVGMVVGLGVMLLVMRSVSAVADATRQKVGR